MVSADFDFDAVMRASEEKEEETSQQLSTESPSESAQDMEVDVSEQDSPAEQPEEPQQQQQQEEEEESPQRTESQVVRGLKVEKVTKDVGDLKRPVEELRRLASELSGKALVDDENADLQSLKTELETVERAQKKARNFGEDLLEDMLALDNLSNLAPQDRSSRRSAYVGIETLLSDVDASKQRFSALKKALEEKIEQAKVSEAEEEEEEAAETSTTEESSSSKSAAVRQPQAQHQEEQRSQRQEAPSAVAAAASAAASAQSPQQEARRSPKQQSLGHPLAAYLPALPTPADWKRIKLPLQFHTREERDRYTILATVPNFDMDDLEATFNEESRTLTVKGLRIPSAEESSTLQRHILSQLQLLAKRSPQRLRQVLASLRPETYLELGQGKYGLFSQSFSVPQDVDVEAIKVDYEDGVLRLRLPKVVLRSKRPLTAREAPMFGAGRFPSGVRHAPRGSYSAMPGLFGGPSDMFYGW